MTKTQYLALSGAIILVIGGLFVFDRSPPMVFVSGGVSPKIVSPGQEISVTIELQWKRLCELDVRRVLRDGAGEEHKLPWGPSAPPAKMPDKPLTSVRKIVVPFEAKIGDKACYRATVYMSCGLFDRLILPIKVEMPCMDFAIVAKP